MPDHFLIQLATDFWVLTGFLCVLLVVLHFFMIYVLKLDKVGWKRTDYFWLGIAALGLMKTTSEVRLMVAESSLSDTRSRVVSGLKELRRVVAQSPTGSLCAKFVKSESSPSDFDERQRQHDVACKWVTSISSLVPESDEPPFKELRFVDTQPPEDITARDVIQSMEWIQRLFDDYEQRRKEYEDLLILLERTDGERTHIIFGPILLCIALAIRITKVTGEIRLERQSKTDPPTANEAKPPEVAKANAAQPPTEI